jgi:hypothetical protein
MILFVMSVRRLVETHEKYFFILSLNRSTAQNYWVFGLFPSSGILETRKRDVSETGSVCVLRWEGKTPTQLVPLERANLLHFRN